MLGSPEEVGNHLHDTTQGQSCLESVKSLIFYTIKEAVEGIGIFPIHNREAMNCGMSC